MVILGAADVDVADVDTATLVFGPARASAVDYPAARSHRGPLPLDVNGDGYRDLLVHFKAGKTGLTALDTEACLVGKIGGQTFWSCSLAEIGVVPAGVGT